MTHIPNHRTYFDDLQIHELLIAAFPDKFSHYEEDSDEQWDATQEFWQELAAEDNDLVLNDFVVRLLHCTSPMRSPLSGTLNHAFGVPSINGDSVVMMAAVSQPCNLER